MSERPVLILGAGLAGLSTAYHLKTTPNVVVEREANVGGTARSFTVGGFTFDITGHLLHLHSAYTKKLIPKLLRNDVFTCVRKTSIYSKGQYTRYPFQAYTKGLPDDVIADCVLGFLKAALKMPFDKRDVTKMNFEAWCHRTFGEGISRHFMTPYNEKLYQTPARSMTTDWCGPFVPMPKLSDVIRGALEETGKSFGYNATFIYPRHGGIQKLAEAFAQSLKGVCLETIAAQIDWKQKRATLSTGETIAYSSLVNTIPLLELLKIMEPLPTAVERARRRLKFASILCVNLGVDRPRISDASWIYFPESKFSFYRVGFPMNFTPHVVPKGCSSMYVEVPLNGNVKQSKARLLADVRRGLIESRILKTSDRFRVVQFIPVKYAYVIYDKERNDALKTIFQFLAANNIHSIGRYGAWKYSFMEEAILDGKKTAEKILNDSRPR